MTEKHVRYATNTEMRHLDEFQEPHISISPVHWQSDEGCGIEYEATVGGMVG